MLLLFLEEQWYLLLSSRKRLRYIVNGQDTQLYNISRNGQMKRLQSESRIVQAQKKQNLLYNKQNKLNETFVEISRYHFVVCLKTAARIDGRKRLMSAFFFNPSPTPGNFTTFQPTQNRNEDEGSVFSRSIFTNTTSKATPAV